MDQYYGGISAGVAGGNDGVVQPIQNTVHISLGVQLESAATLRAGGLKSQAPAGSALNEDETGVLPGDAVFMTRISEARQLFAQPVGAVTKGVILARKTQRWRVEIFHEFSPSWGPVVGVWFADQVIGDKFVHEVATKTLACMKALAEKAPDTENPLSPSEPVRMPLPL